MQEFVLLNMHISHTVLYGNNRIFCFHFQFGRSGLSYASQKGHVEVAEILITNGAQVDLPDKVSVSGAYRLIFDLCISMYAVTEEAIVDLFSKQSIVLNIHTIISTT